MESNYLYLLREIIDSGEEREDRTGVGTYSLFGEHLQFGLQHSFPLLTTKKIFFKGVVHELLWMLNGYTNIYPLTEEGVHIWDEWADEKGDLGPVYGHQWRHFGGDTLGYCQGTDQIKNVIKSLKEDPYSRRHIVSAWNPQDVEYMALPPCHMMFQFYVRRGRLLDCHMYQRSADIFLGVPFNIASYALLTYLVACCTDLVPGRLHISFGDVHLYKNHTKQAEEQLNRTPFDPPILGLFTDNTNIIKFKPEHIQLLDYKYHPALKAPVAV